MDIQTRYGCTDTEGWEIRSELSSVLWPPRALASWLVLLDERSDATFQRRRKVLEGQFVRRLGVPSLPAAFFL